MSESGEGSIPKVVGGMERCVRFIPGIASDLAKSFVQSGRRRRRRLEEVFGYKRYAVHG